MKTITINVSTIKEALHLNNIAAVKYHKFASNPVKGSEEESALYAKIWESIYLQAGEALEELKSETSPSETCLLCGADSSALIDDENGGVLCLACFNEGEIK